MDVIDGTTVLTEANSDSIFLVRVIALAWEYHTFSGDSHLMDKSLITKGINDAVECCKVHSRLSFLSDEGVF